MKVEALKHADVRGKEMTYVKITNSLGTMAVIRVGEENFTIISKMMEEEQKQMKLPLEEKPKETKTVNKK